MMASPGKLPRDEEAYAFEIKWDGVRAITEIDPAGDLRMHSRRLNDITPRYPEVHGIAAAFAGRGVVLDGEVVAFDDKGRPSFGVLQHRMHVAGEGEVRRRMAQIPVVYFVFDVLWLGGQDLTGAPYLKRREILDDLGLQAPAWKVAPCHPGAGTILAEAALAQGLEGIVAKRMDSVYEPGRRSRAWIKIKNVRHQDVVIGGWLPGEGGRSGRIGALLAGYYEEDPAAGLRLRYAGRVGTGFTEQSLADWAAWLEPLARPTSPFFDRIPEKQARFVEPELVGVVEFTEWTSGGTMRHPSFKGRRDDIEPANIRRTAE